MAGQWFSCCGFLVLRQTFVAVSLDILMGKLGHTVTTLVRKTLQEQLLMSHVSWEVYQEGILQESLLHLVLLNILNFYLADSSERR